MQKVSLNLSDESIHLNVSMFLLIKLRLVHQGKVTRALRRAYLGCKHVAHSKCVVNKLNRKRKCTKPRVATE